MLHMCCNGHKHFLMDQFNHTRNVGVQFSQSDTAASSVVRASVDPRIRDIVIFSYIIFVVQYYIPGYIYNIIYIFTLFIICIMAAQALAAEVTMHVLTNLCHVARWTAFLEAGHNLYLTPPPNVWTAAQKVWLYNHVGILPTADPDGKKLNVLIALIERQVDQANDGHVTLDEAFSTGWFHNMDSVTRDIRLLSQTVADLARNVEDLTREIRGGGGGAVQTRGRS
jgi:hypothetical protein